MPSKSKAQRNLMAAAAHNPAFAKKVGVPVAVAQDFNKADKGKKFGSGGMAKSDMKEDMKMDKAQDKAMIKKAFKQHDAQEHKGAKGTKLALKKGGMAKGCGYASGGKVAQLAKANGIAKKGKSRGTLI
jgi:phage tail sheath gpL-like